jgi:hypothetical protein
MQTFGATSTRDDPHVYDIDSLIQARADRVQEARSLPRGAERNQHRQSARSLKTLIESQIQARDLSASPHQ